MMADPGDGSGTFKHVRSNKTVEFKADETIISNYNVCRIFSPNQENSSGIFSLETFNIFSDNCEFSDEKIDFVI